ncbi:MAG: hypothetical protein IJ281_02085 [Clostridia bacterium]|nr:hypothetical protein [Clostridia bacterium]
MHFAMLDLMPILWAMCAAAALLLLFCRSYAAPARTLPAVTAALIAYGMGYPPRVQTGIFLVVFVICAGVWAVLCRIGDWRRRRMAKNSAAPLNEP